MRTTITHLLACVCAYLMMNTGVDAQIGTLDPSFGTGGTVLTPILANYDRTEEVLMQPDGKIIVVGSTYDNLVTGLALARYESDGTLDASFGNAGVQITFTTDSVGIQAVAAVLQADGKILVAGDALPYAFDGLLARYDADGILDPTFGTGGLVMFGGVDSSETMSDVVIRPDGRILVAGQSDELGDFNYTNMLLAQFNADGSVDASFGDNGRVYTNYYDYDYAKAIVLQPDGKCVVAGDFNNSLEIDLMRFDADGNVDVSFGTNGLATAAVVDSYVDDAKDLILQSDGKIVVVGRDGSPTGNSILLARFDGNGALDASFGTAGITIAGFGDWDDGTALALQSDGKILAAGNSTPTGGSDRAFSLVRFNMDGSVDTGFGTDGITRTDFNSADDEAHSIALQADDRIVVCGWVGNGTSFGTARYLNDTDIGIHEHNTAPQFTAYPNPSNGTFTMSDMPMNGSLRILDATGREVRTVRITSTTMQLDLSGVVAGVYHADVLTNGSRSTLPLLVR